MTRTMLITGGSRGIGRATAILAGRQGWRVGVNYVGNAEAAAETVRQVTAVGGAALAIPGDVSLEADVAAMFDATEAAFGPVTALVNNAGIIAEKAMLAEMTGERMRRLFEVNVLGAYLVAREGARRMPTDRGGPGGAIVISSSRAAQLGTPNEFVDYAGSKGATDTLTTGLAKELAPGGVRVNAVRPGLIETEIHAASGQPDRIEKLVRGVPMGRAGTAEEVAEVILWLLSDAASYVTGALVDVGGGDDMTPRRLVTRFYEEVWNRADTGPVPELFHEACTFRGSLGAEREGHDGIAAYVREVTGALEGFRCEIEALVVEDERAFAKMRFSGRHTGPLLGYPPTGVDVSWAGAALFECADGRIRALWVLGDVAGLTAQLEARARVG